MIILLGKNFEIMRHFEVLLGSKKGLLCNKLYNFILANLTLFHYMYNVGLRGAKSIFCCSKSNRAQRNDKNS